MFYLCKMLYKYSAPICYIAPNYLHNRHVTATTQLCNSDFVINWPFKRFTVVHDTEIMIDTGGIKYEFTAKKPINEGQDRISK